MLALLIAAGDGSGMPTTWPGAISCVALLAFFAFVAWLAARD